jgi:hypothetical protein
MNIEKYKERAMTFQDYIEEAQIKNDEDAKHATNIAKDIRELRKAVEREKDDYVKPAKEIQNKAKAVYDPVINLCNGLEKIITSKASEFILTQRKAIEEKQRKIAERVQSGKIKEETGIRQMEKVPEAKKTIQGENGQIRVAEYEDIEVKNEALIPREYMIPDYVRIRKAVLGGAVIPGVEKIKKIRTSLY